MIRRMGRPGLLGMAARTAVVAGTATAVSGGVRRHQDQKAANAQAEAEPQPAYAPPEAPAAPAAMSVEDQVARIKAQEGRSAMTTVDESQREMVAIQRLRERLAGLGGRAAGEVNAAVDHAVRRFEGAPLREFVPLFIERFALEELRRAGAGDGHDGQQ
jgi:hypothetical protein